MADLPEYLAGQNIALPSPIEHEILVAEILALHFANGGATYHLYFGNLLGKRLWAVSPYLERGQDVEGRAIREADLKAFLAANMDLLENPRHAVGMWYNLEDGRTYLDIVILLPDLQAAIEEGEQGNQIAIFDLATQTVIEVGGTGKKEQSDG